MTHDQATHAWAETPAIGAHPDDRNGLFEMRNTIGSKVKNTLGALLIFTPIMNSAAAATDSGTAGDYVLLAGASACPPCSAPPAWSRLSA